MEADLLHYYNVDYLDRWRGRLTLRRIFVLVRNLPSDSSVWAALRDGPDWTLEAHLLDDLRLALTGSKPHPTRPVGKPRVETPERQRRLAAARRRLQARRQAIEAGEIT